MKPSHDILIIGRYDRLVFARAELLRRYGYDVVEATDVDCGVKEFSSQEFSAIVLCQSLSLNECKHLAAVIKSVAPASALVVLGHMVEEADFTLEALFEPRSFLNSIEAIAPKKCIASRESGRPPAAEKIA